MSRAALRTIRLFGLALVGSLLLALSLGPAAGRDDEEPHDPVVQALGGDRFMAGGEVAVGRAVEGDLVVAGGTIDIDAPVAGDVLALGGQVRVSGDVGGSYVGAGGQTTIAGKVGRNLRVAGGRVELAPRAEVAGNVSVGVGVLRLRGHVRGQVLAAGGRVLVDGPVDGDVVAGGGEIELGPDARIAGKLRYRSGQPLRQDPAAQVAGGIERLTPLAHREAAEKTKKAGRVAAVGAAVMAGMVWTLGLVLLAALLIVLMPGTCAAVARSLRGRPGASLLLGFAVLVCVPVAAVLLLVTLVGAPLALVALAFYAALLVVAYVGAAIAVGDGLLQRWRPQAAGRPAPRVGAAALVLVLLSLLGLLPVLGALVGLAMLLAGLGALALQLRRPSAAA
ncbi:MAG: polymer-forming cytoskeletal protein [Leptothrix sp. (in: Bacteria)]|nr:polymer-forming cytoskeletal protein [Leptothrix sp. (in: b-proteobacteria)]